MNIGARVVAFVLLVLIPLGVWLALSPDSFVRFFRIADAEVPGAGLDAWPVWLLLAGFLSCMAANASMLADRFMLRRQERMQASGFAQYLRPPRPVPKVESPLAGVCFMLFFGASLSFMLCSEYVRLESRFGPYPSASEINAQLTCLYLAWLSLAVTLGMLFAAIPARNTFAFRRPVEFAFGLVMVVGCLVALFTLSSRLKSTIALLCLLAAWVSFASFRAFMIPSSRLSAVPAGLGVASLAGAPFGPFLTLPGLLFPTHRRLRALWKPTPLPRLNVPRGLVRIELLIILAAIATGWIFSLTLVHSPAPIQLDQQTLTSAHVHSVYADHRMVKEASA